MKLAANTQGLCWLRVIKKGMLLAMAATTAPIPRLTKRIGSAQHINVLVEANKTNQPQFLGFSLLSLTTTATLFVLLDGRTRNGSVRTKYTTITLFWA